MKNKHTGSTLIEVLIALLVFSIGLQGIASLQLQSIKENFDSSQRSHGIWAAHELINRVRANSTGREDGAYITDPDVDPCATTPTTYCADKLSTDAATCNSTQMATFDVWETLCQNDSVLLDLSVELTCADADTTDGDACTKNSDFTLTMEWQSKSVADDSENISNTLETQQFIQVFKP